MNRNEKELLLKLASLVLTQLKHSGMWEQADKLDELINKLT